MSEHALGFRGDRHDTLADRPQTSVERDLVEASVRAVSRFAGYLSLAAAVAGIAYLVIR